MVEEFQAAAAGQLEPQPNRQNSRTVEAAGVEDLAGEVDWGMLVVEERMGWVACSSSPAERFVFQPPEDQVAKSMVPGTSWSLGIAASNFKWLERTEGFSTPL